MKKLFPQLIAILAMFGLSAAVAGAKVPIYEDVQIVTDKSVQARQTAMRDAFANVLVKVSGNKQIMTIPSIEKIAAHPEQYLQAFEYQEQAKSAAASTGKVSNPQNIPVRFVFESHKVNQLLKQQGMGVWHAYRPNVLIWWAQGLDPLAQSSEIIGHDNPSLHKLSWHRQAQKRGLVTTFPMTDLATLSVIDVQDIWQLNQDKIQQASQRYPSDEQVVVTTRPGQDGYWHGNVTIVGSRDQAGWDFKHSDPGMLVANMVDRLSDHYSQRQAMVQTEQPSRQLNLMVSNIRDGLGYQKVNEYLSGLAQVKDVQALWMKGDSILLGIQYQGDENLFSEQIRYDNMLKPSNREIEAAANADLQYKFIG